MRNGQLASGSGDYTIKIWNIVSGKCTQTLQGHSDLVYQLLQLKSGDLVSCSRKDHNIKIWNLTEGICIRTLVGHTCWVISIIVNSQSNTLVSSSQENTIKTWNLETGECVNTLEIQNEDDCLNDLIFI